MVYGTGTGVQFGASPHGHYTSPTTPRPHPHPARSRTHTDGRDRVAMRGRSIGRSTTRRLGRGGGLLSPAHLPVQEATAARLDLHGAQPAPGGPDLTQRTTRANSARRPQAGVSADGRDDGGGGAPTAAARRCVGRRGCGHVCMRMRCVCCLCPGGERETVGHEPIRESPPLNSRGGRPLGTSSDLARFLIAGASVVPRASSREPMARPIPPSRPRGKRTVGHARRGLHNPAGGTSGATRTGGAGLTPRGAALGCLGL